MVSSTSAAVKQRSFPLFRCDLCVAGASTGKTLEAVESDHIGCVEHNTMNSYSLTNLSRNQAVYQFTNTTCESRKFYQIHGNGLLG